MIRTRDLLIRSQTLYPAELHAHIYIFPNKNLFFVKEKFIKRMVKSKLILNLENAPIVFGKTAHIFGGFPYGTSINLHFS